MSDISVRIRENADGVITVQRIHPEGTLDNFFGSYLNSRQIAELASCLLFRGHSLSEFTSNLPHEVDNSVLISQIRKMTPKERTRYEWDKMRSNVAPAIFDNNSWECVACHNTCNLTVDHIIPIDKGGTNELDNLQTLCQSCNSSKGAR